MKNAFEGPTLVKTQKGSSVLFRGQLLYSKYDPRRTIISQIERTVFKDAVLVILASPVFDYGIVEILSRINTFSYLLAIQPEKILYKFTQSHLGENYFLNFKANTQNFLFACIESETDFNDVFIKLDEQYDFRQVVIIMSSVLPRTDTHQIKYFENIQQKTENHLKQKIINRLTLIEMGHSFSANIFKNLTYIYRKQKFGANFKTVYDLKVTKPIFILAAGSSLNSTMEKLVFYQDYFFIIATDAVASLVSARLKLDAVIILESQVFITPAFIGLKYYTQKNDMTKKTILFADLTTAHQITKNWKGDIFFYFTKYANANFLSRISNLKIFSDSYKSVGSVGLASIQVALTIRENSNVPIFCTGLDFCYAKNFTHSKYSFQVKKLFSVTNKLNPLFNGDYFFKNNILKFKKNDFDIFTNEALNSYKNIFSEVFSFEKNLYLIKSFIHNSDLTFENCLNIVKSTPIANFTVTKKTEQNNNIKNFLSDCKIDLKKIKEFLEMKKKFKTDLLYKLILKNDFLFLHFPDYSTNFEKVMLEKSFLARVKIEVKYFLKFIL